MVPDLAYRGKCQQSYQTAQQNSERFGSWSLQVPQIAGRGEELIMGWFVERLYEGQLTHRDLPHPTLQDDYLSFTPEEERRFIFLRSSTSDGPQLMMFWLVIFQLYGSAKGNSFSRNCTSNFDLFPGHQHALWYSLTRELQRAQKSQNSLEEEVQSWRTTTTWFQILWYSYSKQYI